MIWRRGEVQHRVGQPGDACEANSVIQIARNRDHPQGTQAGELGSAPHQGKHPIAPREQWNYAHCDVTAADYQEPIHAAIIMCGRMRFPDLDCRSHFSSK
jgi:hypothetical protein